MREIEYRGKTSQGNWVYGNYVNPKNWCVFGNYHRPKDDKFGFIIEQCWVEGGRFYSNGVRWCLKDTIGQYTGLKDKNGTKIFEGDCFGDSSNREIDVVVFEDGCFQLKTYYFAECSLDGNAYESRFGAWGTEPLCNFNLSNDEIIGNIFDNPELLRGEYE